MTASTLESSSGTAAPAGGKLARVAQIENGHARLTRRLGPVRGFPRALGLGGRQIEVVGDPELILLVDLMRPADGEYRHRYFHDVICQLVLANQGGSCTVSVNLITSRTAPSTEAAMAQGSVRPGWLNLSEVDDVVCAMLASISVREKFSESIALFIERWVTEYSLRAIATLKDDAVAAALRKNDAALYAKLLAYLDDLPGANADTISNHMRTALVAPRELAAMLASQPARNPGKREHPEFERTMEIRGERNRRDQAA